MSSIWRILGWSALFWLTGAIVFGGDCRDNQRLRASFQEKPFIQVSFRQVTYSDVFAAVDTTEGRLWAGRNGRFRLLLPGQAIVSDGILYWSYSEENRQALVDSVCHLGDWNPITLLYDPERVYRCQSQVSGQATISFAMVANDTLTKPRELTLEAALADFTPRKLTYADDNGSRVEVIIRSFGRKEILPDSLFEFHPASGVEVIQMP